MSGEHAVSPAEASDELRNLARRVLRLNPDRHDPERFLILKDDVAADLRRLAKQIEAQR